MFKQILIITFKNQLYNIIVIRYILESLPAQNCDVQLMCTVFFILIVEKYVQ